MIENKKFYTDAKTLYVRFTDTLKILIEIRDDGALSPTLLKHLIKIQRSKIESLDLLIIEYEINNGITATKKT